MTLLIISISMLANIIFFIALCCKACTEIEIAGPKKAIIHWGMHRRIITATTPDELLLKIMNQLDDLNKGIVPWPDKMDD